MTGALRAEWLKFQTTAGPAWLLLGVVMSTVALSCMAMAATSCRAAACVADTPKLSLTGVQLGQAVVAVLAVLTVSNEYAAGMIRTTLTAVPCRSVVLVAKSIVVTGPILVAGLLGVAGSTLAGRLILPGRGFTVERGFAPLSPLDGPTLRATAGSVLYLALVGLLSLGVATLLRDSAAATGTVLGLLYLPPLLLQAVGDPAWHRRLERLAPGTAGLNIEATVGLRTLTLSPWAGLGVLAVWSAAALLLGGAWLIGRDA